MALKIYTQTQKNNYVRCILGIACISISAYLDKDKSDEFSLQKIVSKGKALVLMSLLGLAMMFSSCARMYYRLGIVPGVYHTTLCVPSFHDDNFTFKIKPGFYFAVFAGIFYIFFLFLNFILTFDSQQSSILSIHFQVYVGVALTIMSYYDYVVKKNEIIGNLLTFMWIQVFIVYNGLSYDELAYIIGIILAFTSFFFVFFIEKSKKTLDAYSTMIIFLFTQGFAGIVIEIVGYFYGFSLRIGYEEIINSLLYSIIVYSLIYCKKIEIALFFSFPTISSIPIFYANAFGIAIFIGIIVGFLINIIGDCLAKKCFCDKEQSAKSPLHSPLL